MPVAVIPELAPRHVVILCHPERESFNAAVADAYIDAVQACGHRAILRDLYAMGFDPVLKALEQTNNAHFTLLPDVAAELDILADLDVLVLVYPIWFASPPAMLKGYIDRVLGSGISHRAIRAAAPHPLLAGKRMLSFTSSGTTKQWLEEQAAWSSLKNGLDAYLAKAFALGPVDHVHFSAIVRGLKERFVLEELERVRERAKLMCSQFVMRSR